MTADAKPLGDLMVTMGLIGRDDLDRALELQEASGARLGEVLLDMGLLGEEALRWALARQLDIPLIHPDPKALDPEALKLISPEICRRYGVLPISLLPEEDDSQPVLTVAAADPGDRAAIDDLRGRMIYPLKVVAGLREEIMKCLDKLYGPALNPDLEMGGAYLQAVSDPTGLKLLGILLERMQGSEPRALHLYQRGGRTRARDGAGNDVFSGGADWLRILIERVRKLSGLSPTYPGASQRGRLVYSSGEGAEVLLRAVILRGVAGEELHLRAIEWENRGRSLEDLGLSPEQSNLVREALLRPGLVLVAAPGEEGVLSTLYALMREVAGEGRCVTLEEEVVYRSPAVLQLEVAPGEELTELLRDLKYMEFDRVLLGKVSRELVGDLLPLARRGKWVFAGMEEANLADAVLGLAFNAGRGPLHGLSLIVHQRLVKLQAPSGQKMKAFFQVMPVGQEFRDAVSQGYPDFKAAKKLCSDLDEELKAQMAYASAFED